MRMGDEFYIFCAFISKSPLACYVLPPPPNPSAPPQGYCHAAAAGILGASQDAVMSGCSRVAEDVARSPALLSRPAALCKRLGLCHGNCLVDGTTSNNTTSSSNAVLAPAKDAIDLCSPTGLVSGRFLGSESVVTNGCGVLLWHSDMHASLPCSSVITWVLQSSCVGGGACMSTPILDDCKAHVIKLLAAITEDTSTRGRVYMPSCVPLCLFCCFQVQPLTAILTGPRQGRAQCASAAPTARQAWTVTHSLTHTAGPSVTKAPAWTREW